MRALKPPQYSPIKNSRKERKCIPVINLEYGRKQMTKLAVTIPEAVQMTGIGRTSLYLLIKEKKLTRRKLGKRTLLLVEDLERVVKSLPEAA
jgi:predicted DNA-binding transcriptional regulator AlpA